MSLGEPRIEYVEARRVLLDVLVALDAHRASLILVGAQAVYLRCAGRLTTYQPFTTDADVVIDPSTLGSTPPLEAAMTEAGFVPADQPGTWEARFERAGFADTVVVPVDLIVPSQVAAQRGSRAARLPDPHGKRTARKTDGLEGALVDHDSFVLTALEPSDQRTLNVNVAGVAALLVAKSHKLGERIATPARLHAKDAGDVYRLFDATDADAMAGLLRRLLADERSASATEEALSFVQQLFRTEKRRGPRHRRVARDLARGDRHRVDDRIRSRSPRTSRPVSVGARNSEWCFGDAPADRSAQRPIAIQNVWKQGYLTAVLRCAKAGTSVVHTPPCPTT